MPEVFWAGLTEFAEALRGIQERATESTEAAVEEGAELIEANAKKHASGRPGPNVGTGTLRRSIHVEGPERAGLLGYAATIGPSVVYARRVELGFVGEDAIGRVYASPANPAKYPYLQPGLEDSLPELPEIFERSWGTAVNV